MTISRLMIRSRSPRRWRGTTTVELAIVSPVLLVVLFGLVICALGVFRYQQVAALAREGARWASLHGAQYSQETGNPAATAVDVYNNAIAPKMVGLDPSSLTYSVTWNSHNNPFHTLIDSNGNLVKMTNTVSVRVDYL
jgi:Flp pilus assembly protein TadG